VKTKKTNQHFVKTVHGLAAVLFVLSVFAPPLFSYPLKHSFTIIEETSSHIIIAYALHGLPAANRGEFQPETDCNDDDPCGRKPLIHRSLLGVPDGGEIFLDVLESVWEDIPRNMSEQLCEVCAKGPVSPDAAGRSGETVSLRRGRLRAQHVAIISVSPLRCDDTSTPVRLLRKALIKLNVPPENSEPKRCTAFFTGAEESFEPILRAAILNYGSLGRCKQGSSGGVPSRKAALPDVRQAEGLSPVKIHVREKGIYTVSYTDIVYAGGQPHRIDPAQASLRNMGYNVDFLFVGDDAHSFAPGDYLLFYAEPVESTFEHLMAYNTFKLENVYWLYPEAGYSNRMLEQQKPQVDAPAMESYKDTVHLEAENIVLTEHIDSYLWEMFPDYDDSSRDDSLRKDFSCSLAGIDTTRPVAVRVLLKGKNDFPDIDPDHHARISINSTWSAEVFFDGMEPHMLETYTSGSVFHEGENTVTVEKVADTEREDDIFYLDWIELDYYRSFTAVDNELFFTVDSPEAYNVTADGFTSSAVMLFDITNPLEAVSIGGIDPRFGAGGYGFSFGEDTGGTRHYLALTTDRIKKPCAVVLDEASRLQDTSNRADYIMITHADFYDALQRLADYRRSEGYAVEVVNVQDIYDEFNSGIQHPRAIKDFLEYAFHSWSAPAPTFVLLVGDGCSDATDRLNLGNTNFIPAKLVGYETPVPKDSGYVMVSGDDILPDMYLGRLPVKTADQLRLIIDKIIAYDSSSKEGWIHDIQFVAGTIDNDNIFKDTNEILSETVPSSYNHELLTEDDFSWYPDENASTIIAKLNQGRGITVYTGHASIIEWPRLIDTSYFDGFRNWDMPTFLISLSCSNGDFSNPVAEGFGEELLRIPGGAVACFTPSGGGLTSEHKEVGMNVLTALFSRSTPLLGSACTQAAVQAYQDGILLFHHADGFSFFGDPATRFNVKEIYLSEPDDSASLSGLPAFSWTTDDYSRFIIQFSPFPDFPAFSTLTFFTDDTSYAPRLSELLLLDLMSMTYSSIYWRVGGLKGIDEADGFFDLLTNLLAPYVTQPRSFTMQ